MIKLFTSYAGRTPMDALRLALLDLNSVEDVGKVAEIKMTKAEVFPDSIRYDIELDYEPT